ncbi:GlxA family transcriptional regulator [Streptomyces sp. SID2888]|uniref:GlxA family transcriptional regulator n=1 Tax=Streptomyces sp. SID2888 TaxID=2690256 RepID=UPI001F463222|nr:GlxA family transcriptional regulator [Streptomyces sp. SID2888]
MTVVPSPHLPPAPHRPHRVLMVLFDGVQVLDATGPLEVYGAANAYGGDYRITTASLDGKPVTATAGVRLMPDLALDEVDLPLDTLMVPGRPDWWAAVSDTPLVTAVARLAAASGTVASICAGAFPLAATGLLEGRQVATHWRLAADLAARYPGLTVDSDAVFVRDGRFVTSAGITAGIDLALSLVEADLGADVARATAKHLVVFMARPGGQSQFSVRQSARYGTGSVLRHVLDAVTADPRGDHTLTAMARRAGVSERHLTRLFRTETGMTAAQFVERIRLEAAQALLESGGDPLDSVARASGFGSVETMRRAFRRILGVTPGAYRDRFRTTRRQDTQVAGDPCPSAGHSGQSDSRMTSTKFSRSNPGT